MDDNDDDFGPHVTPGMLKIMRGAATEPRAAENVTHVEPEAPPEPTKCKDCVNCKRRLRTTDFYKNGHGGRVALCKRCWSSRYRQIGKRALFGRARRELNHDPIDYI